MKTKRLQKKLLKKKKRNNMKSFAEFVNERYEAITEGKTISGMKLGMMGAKILGKIKIGSKFNTDNGTYTVTGFGQQSNAFKEFEADFDGKACKVKLTAMYGIKLEYTNDPRSGVYRNEVRLDSITL